MAHGSSDDTRPLADALCRALDLAEVADVRQLSGGASRQTFTFTATGDDLPARRLVLQRERPGGTERAVGVAAQAAILRVAARAGAPVPALVDHGDDDGIGGPWLVTEHVEGETIARRILRDEEYRDARSVLTVQCAAALAAIHRIDCTSIELPESDDILLDWRDLMDGYGHPHPAFELAFRWLADRRPPSVRRGLVHGDFRLGNLIVDGSGLAAVLDWELAHVGDPIEDLGWLCVNAWRFGGSEPVAGVGRYDELLDAYETASGVAVDPAHLRWWETFGTLRWGLICITQSEAHRQGRHRSVELAAIGRRVCENELDLLELVT